MGFGLLLSSFIAEGAAVVVVVVVVVVAEDMSVRGVVRSERLVILGALRN